MYQRYTQRRSWHTCPTYIYIYKDIYTYLWTKCWGNILLVIQKNIHHRFVMQIMFKNVKRQHFCKQLSVLSHIINKYGLQCAGNLSIYMTTMTQSLPRRDSIRSLRNRWHAYKAPIHKKNFKHTPPFERNIPDII